jgi:uncharacterized protein (TIGR00369 family)
LGIELADLGEGWLETRLVVEERHLQQDGLVHGGVLATLADLSCALAAYTLLAPGQRIVTVEMKLNFLRPVERGVVRCRGEVLKAGRTLTVSEGKLYAERDGQEVLIGAALATLAALAGKE